MRRLKVLALAVAGVVLPVALVFSAYMIAQGSIGAAGTVPPVPQNRVVDQSGPSTEPTDDGRGSGTEREDSEDRRGSDSDESEVEDSDSDNSGPGGGGSDNSGPGGGGSDSSGKGSGDD
jgi:hypothetical protein